MLLLVKNPVKPSQGLAKDYIILNSAAYLKQAIIIIPNLLKNPEFCNRSAPFPIMV